MPEKSYIRMIKLCEQEQWYEAANAWFAIVAQRVVDKRPHLAVVSSPLRYRARVIEKNLSPADSKKLTDMFPYQLQLRLGFNTPNDNSNMQPEDFEVWASRNWVRWSGHYDHHKGTVVKFHHWVTPNDLRIKPDGLYNSYEDWYPEWVPIHMDGSQRDPVRYRSSRRCWKLATETEIKACQELNKSN